MLNSLKFFGKKNFLVNSDNLGKKILSLPISEEHTVRQIIFVCKKIQQFFKN
jgi:dTDP-4-amino-4,6-dideoxygalactose transaminase